MEKETPPHILATPLWILILRGFQFLMSLIILAMAGKLVSDVMIEENALALAIVRQHHLPHQRLRYRYST
jgi:uncharacterized membrane protein YvlD (DUF360 family)